MGFLFRVFFWVFSSGFSGVFSSGFFLGFFALFFRGCSGLYGFSRGFFWGFFRVRLRVALKGYIRLKKTCFPSLSFVVCGHESAEKPPFDNTFSMGHVGPLAPLCHALGDMSRCAFHHEMSVCPSGGLD